MITLEHQFEIKINIPCKIKTKNGSIYAGYKILSEDETSIKTTCRDRNIIAISDIVSIEYKEGYVPGMDDDIEKEEKNVLKAQEKPSRRNLKIVLMAIAALLAVIVTITLLDTHAENVKKQDAKLEKIVNEKYAAIKEGMTLEEVNQLMGFEGELQGESTEDEILYESYIWDFGKTDKNYYRVSCDFENGKETVSGVMDSKGFRNSLGESTRD